jgi:hypothetical protein
MSTLSSNTEAKSSSDTLIREPPRSTAIATRTKLLFALTLLLLVPAIRIAHTRLILCESKPHPNSHRAPISGASGNPADFGCKLLAPATPTEKILDLALFITTLAFFRSALIDIHTCRQRHRDPQIRPIEPN